MEDWTYTYRIEHDFSQLHSIFLKKYSTAWIIRVGLVVGPAGTSVPRQ